MHTNIRTFLPCFHPALCKIALFLCLTLSLWNFHSYSPITFQIPLFHHRTCLSSARAISQFGSGNTNSICYSRCPPPSFSFLLHRIPLAFDMIRYETLLLCCTYFWSSSRSCITIRTPTPLLVDFFERTASLSHRPSQRHIHTTNTQPYSHGFKVSLLTLCS